MSKRLILGRKPECGCIEVAEVCPDDTAEAFNIRAGYAKRGYNVSTVTLEEYNKEPIGCRHEAKQADVARMAQELDALRERIQKIEREWYIPISPEEPPVIEPDYWTPGGAPRWGIVSDNTTDAPTENNHLHLRYYWPVANRNLHSVCPNCHMTYWNGYPHTCPTSGGKP